MTAELWSKMWITVRCLGCGEVTTVEAYLSRGVLQQLADAGASLVVNETLESSAVLTCWNCTRWTPTKTEGPKEGGA